MATISPAAIQSGNILEKLLDKGKRTTNDISEWYNGLHPDTKKMINYGLAGAAVGGASGHFLGSGRDKDRARVSPALMGMLAGTTAGISIPAGLKLLSGEGLFDAASGDSMRPLPAKVIDTLPRTISRNPAKIILPAAMLATGRGTSAYRLWRHGMSHTASHGHGGIHAYSKDTLATGPIKDLFKAVLRGKNPGGRKAALKSVLRKFVLPGGGHATSASNIIKNKTLFRGPYSAFRRAAMALGSRKLWDRAGRDPQTLKRVSDEIARNPKYSKLTKGRAGLLAIPAAIGAGYIADKYWKGDW